MGSYGKVYYNEDRTIRDIENWNGSEWEYFRRDLLENDEFGNPPHPEYGCFGKWRLGKPRKVYI